MRQTQHGGLPARLFLIIISCSVCGYLGVQYVMSPAPTLSDVDRAVRLGDLKSARKLLAEICQDAPGDLEAVGLLADLCEKLGDNVEAVRWLETAQVGDDPDGYCRALCRAAALCVSESLPGRAEQSLRKALSVDESFLPARNLLVRLKLLVSDQPEVQTQVALLDHAGAATIEDVLLYFPGGQIRWDDETYLDWLEKAHENEPQNLRVVARLLQVLPREGRDSDAQNLLREFESHTSQCWQLALAAADHRFSLRDYAGALYFLKQTEESAHYSAQVWLLQGKILHKLLQNETARLCFQNARILDPMDPAIHAALSGLGRDSGVDPAMLRYYEEYADCRNDFWESVGDRRVLASKLSRLLLAFDQPRASAVVDAHLKGLVVGHRDPLRKPQDLNILKVDTERFAKLPDDTLVSSSDSSGSAVRFQDVTNSTNLKYSPAKATPIPNVLTCSLGNGVAMFDYDNDLWPDLYFAQGQNEVGVPKSSATDQIFRNERGTRNSEVSARAGIQEMEFSHGVTIGDYDNDGFQDVYICNIAADSLFRNNGDGTFSNVTLAAAVTASGWSTSAAFVDLDRDGDLDLYVVRYVTASYKEQLHCSRHTDSRCRPNDFDAEADLLYENVGNGMFVDRSEQIRGHKGKGLGVAVTDYNGDGWPDVFVGNDTTRNLLFRNTSAETPGRLSLRESAMEVGVAVGSTGQPQACMGVAISDVDHDSHVDLLVTNYEFESNSLYANYSGSFEESSSQFRLSALGWNKMGWGAQFVDVNNDSFDDLIILNSHLFDRPMQTDVLISQAGESFVAAVGDVGIASKTMGRAMAAGDWDLDGRTDFVQTQLNENASLYLNSTPCPAGSLLRLVGRYGSRDARDAVVTAISAEGQRFRIRSPLAAGYLTTNPQGITIPPGHAAEVLWSGGETQKLKLDSGALTQVVIEPR